MVGVMQKNSIRFLERKLFLARATIGFERGWSASFSLVMVCGLITLILICGVLGYLPGSFRTFALCVLALAFLWSLRPLLAWRKASNAEALRRLEVQSSLQHRPLATLDDELAGPPSDGQTRVLWQEHRARIAASISRLHVGLPRSDWQKRDPFALRNCLGLALIAAVILNADDWKSHVAASLDPTAAASTGVHVDAWITPPNYTGKAPVLLTDRDGAGHDGQVREVLVPEKSALIVRFNDAIAPSLRLAKPLEDGSAGETISELPLVSRQGSAVYETKTTIERPVTIVAGDQGRTIGGWHVSVIPDTPPEVSIAGPVEPTANSAISFPWVVRDDYGVSSLRAKIKLSDQQDDGEGISSNGVFLYDPPSFSIQLPKTSMRSGNGKAIQDLTQHPWAGLMVEMTLLARDQAGQATESKPARFKLPEREFSKPLAKALIEQRRKLVMRPDDRDSVVSLLDALTLWPEGVVDESGIYLGVRLAETQLYRAQSEKEVKDVVDLLWTIAAHVEDGDVADAKQQLDAARKALEDALARGAPADKVAELMQRLREAMDRFLTAMMDEARRNQAGQGNQRDGNQPMADRTIAAEDLNRMLDAIEKMARSGANEAAQQLLSRLDDILSNLQAGNAQKMNPGMSSALGQMLDQLGDILKRQQNLMDRTFRMPDLGRDSQSGEENSQAPGKNGEGFPDSQGLAQEQQQLGDLLDQLMKKLGQNGMEPPSPFGSAERNMGEAAGALKRSQRGTALSEQDQALQDLREGAESFARNLMQQGMGSQNNYGRHGEARGDDRDPLGRPLPNRGEDFGPERNMLPSEAAIEKARQILEYLRGRTNDAATPKLERDYLDRLLRGLY